MAAQNAHLPQEIEGILSLLQCQGVVLSEVDCLWGCLPEDSLAEDAQLPEQEEARVHKLLALGGARQQLRLARAQACHELKWGRLPGHVRHHVQVQAHLVQSQQSSGAVSAWRFNFLSARERGCHGLRNKPTKPAPEMIRERLLSKSGHAKQEYSDYDRVYCEHFHHGKS